ncbi:MAG: ATP-binding cassette domain-containing protein [Puniceicoccales bacterium]|jgi:putative ABC transport system ATP-binding protein|nr:ATP-binding cassette domain-containing protein [Puniceicoccales bacterium]
MCPENFTPGAAPVPVLSANKLSYWFEEGGQRQRVLQDITVDIFPGEIVFVMGPSGSGKSTLLKLFGAQRAVQSGSLKVNGRELTAASAHELVVLRRGIGFIFQSHHLLKSLTASQNVQMPLINDARHNAASAHAAALAMLEKVGLADQANKRPGHMSGGQNQRVAIARALVSSPSLVLADEPTASLDKQTGREAVNLLENLARRNGVAIVLVTHDSRILDIADRILLLEDGRLTGEERPSR